MKRLTLLLIALLFAAPVEAGIKYSYSPSSSSSAPEGTAVLSTGETGGTKFLGEDGDGTSSWKTVSASNWTDSGTYLQPNTQGDTIRGYRSTGASYAEIGVDPTRALPAVNSSTGTLETRSNFQLYDGASASPSLYFVSEAAGGGGEFIALYQDNNRDFYVDNLNDTTSNMMYVRNTGAGTLGLDVEGSFFLTEKAAADADTAAKGQIWVKNTTPNQLWFTDDAGTDTQLGVSNGNTGVFGTTINGNGSTITTGIHSYLIVPYSMTLNKVTMLADTTGSIVVDVWKDSYANYPPTDADSITASAVPTITTSNKSQDAVLSGWTTSISAGDIIVFNVDSVTDLQTLVITLEGTKT